MAAWRARLNAWLGRSHPLARLLATVIAPAATIITTLLALGIISPFGSGDALADSAGSTVDAGSSRVALRVDTRADGQPTSYTADGVFDYRTGQGRFVYDFSGTPELEDATAVESRFNRGVVFMRFEPGSGVPPERPWVRVDLAATDELLREAADAGALPDAAPDLGILADVGFTDPSRVLDDLRDSGEVEDLGTERLFGVETHKYRGTLGPARAGGDRVQTTAWIGDGDVIRRLVLSSDGPGGAVETVMDFSDFGTKADARPPPARQVTDVVELLEELVAGA